MTENIGIVGGGVMGEALLAGLLAQEVALPSTVVVSEPSAARRDVLRERYGVTVTEDNGEALAQGVVLLAVKPQVWVGGALREASQTCQGLVLSIMAGVSLAGLAAQLPQAAGLVRAMPNTPAQVGAGITAIAWGRGDTAANRAIAQRVLGAVGAVVEVAETDLDAVTGLSGSGPAYVAVMIEALADGGVAAGLSRAIAQQLALATVLGTAQLLQAQELHPAVLKDRVASPGGTTIAGLGVLEARAVRAALREAVVAAAQRSQELGS
ncbi:MAG: pyrroline-5-carboxylate reductase [Pseudanabaenaceae cyanobacterium]